MNMNEVEDVLSTAAAWRAAGEQVALATVTETWGSSPRPAGSQMAVTKSGKMAGSVSGGCIEGAVADAAHEDDGDRHAAIAGFRRDQRARLGGRPGLRRQGEGVRGEAVREPLPLAGEVAPPGRVCGRTLLRARRVGWRPRPPYAATVSSRAAGEVSI